MLAKTHAAHNAAVPPAQWEPGLPVTELFLKPLQERKYRNPDQNKRKSMTLSIAFLVI